MRNLFAALFIFVSLTMSVMAQSILVDTYTERGKLAFESGDYESAEKLLKAALSEANAMKNKTLIANTSVNLGKVYQSKGSHGLAEPLYLKAIEIFDELDGPGSERSAFAINNLGLMYAEMKLYSKSEEFLRRALADREKLFGSDDPDVAVTLMNLGKLYSDQSKYAEADAVYVKALQILIQHPEMTEEILVGLHNLALSTRALNNPNRTEAAYKMSISIIEKKFGKTSHRLIEPLSNYGEFLRSRKRTTDAILVERRLKLLKK